MVNCARSSTSTAVVELRSTCARTYQSSVSLSSATSASTMKVTRSHASATQPDQLAAYVTGVVAIVCVVPTLMDVDVPNVPSVPMASGQMDAPLVTVTLAVPRMTFVTSRPVSVTATIVYKASIVTSVSSTSGSSPPVRRVSAMALLTTVIRPLASASIVSITLMATTVKSKLKKG